VDFPFRGLYCDEGWGGVAGVVLVGGTVPHLMLWMVCEEYAGVGVEGC